jgi:hypothetical protein
MQAQFVSVNKLYKLWFTLSEFQRRKENSKDQRREENVSYLRNLSSLSLNYSTIYPQPHPKIPTCVVLFYLEDGSYMFSEGMVFMCQTTRRHIPESNLDPHSRGIPACYKHKPCDARLWEELFTLPSVNTDSKICAVAEMVPSTLTKDSHPRFPIALYV